MRPNPFAPWSLLVVLLPLAFGLPAHAACTAGNPNANLIESTPTVDFTDNLDGTVTHAKTGLMWKQCAEGLSGAACATGTATPMTWENALKAATTSTFAGYTDWRLPNKKELESIVERCGFDPAINGVVFPATPTSAFLPATIGSPFWSGSSYVPNPLAAWNVFFFNGVTNANLKVDNLSGPSLAFVRLVRGGQSVDSFDLSATPPSVTDAITNEDTQTTTGLVVSRSTFDTTSTHFKITGITNGTLFQNDGTTAINNGNFITFAQGNAGLKFTPGANLFSPATTFSLQVQASTSSGDAGLFGTMATATITVNPLADTPSVTNATTNEDTQTASGLVISRNPADGTEVTHFKITNIQNGTLFQNDGTTAINSGDFITFAQGNAGLKFTSGANLFSPGTTFRFDAQASTSSANGGLGGSVVTATITVNAVADSPSVTNASTSANVQTTSGLVISRNAADGTEVTHFKITNIQNGTLFQNNGTTPINSDDFTTFAQGNAGLKFTPTAGSLLTGHFTVQASLSNTNPGLGGSTVTADISVGSPVVSVTSPSATGTGNMTASFTGGGAGCGYTVSQFIPLTGNAASPPAGSAPAGVSFPHGLFNFTVTGCTPGSVLNFTITYPQPLPPGTQYWKYGPTSANASPHWYTLGAANNLSIAGNTVSFTITDGGLGDDDLAANGTIVDQGGPGVLLAPIPALSVWALALLVLLLFGFGAQRARRRR